MVISLPRIIAALTIILLFFTFFPSALANTTCKTENCMITITIKLAFAGANDSQINSWKNDIESVWNGPNNYQTFGDCNCPVSFKVETMKITNASQINCKPPPAGYHCVMVTPWNGTTESLPLFYNSSGQKEYVVAYMGYSTQSPTTGASIDGWWSDQTNRPVNASDPSSGTYHDAAHEAGHLMGLQDGSGGLMNFTSGPNATPSQTNIDQAVSNVCGANACPDRCCCGNGQIDSKPKEACDPMAAPNGCTSGEYCCPVCCNCYQTKCVASSGEYDSQQQCQATCAQGLSCYYNYKTGCWDCLKQDTVAHTINYDPSKFMQIQELNHGVGIGLIQINLTQFVGLKPLETVPMGNMFANEKINIYIEDNSMGHIVFVDGEIKQTGFEEMKEQTMNMKMSNETMQKIISGETSFEQEIVNGEIKLEGVGFANSFKVGLANFGLWIYSFFE